MRTKNLVTEAGDDTQTAYMEASMQCNNGTETNSNYTHSSNTTNTQQIEIAVDKKVNGETDDSSNKGRQQNRHIADQHCKTNI